MEFNESTVIHRACVGRHRTVGDLYNAWADNNFTTHLFTERSVNVSEKYSFNIEVFNCDSYEDKFSKLNIDPSLQMSILAGLCRLDDCESYLTDAKGSARIVQESMILHVETKKETLNWNEQCITSPLSIAFIEVEKFTHLVEEVHWGANLVVTCTCENRENEDISELSEKLRAYMENLKIYKLGKQLNIDGSLDNKPSDENLSLKIQLFGDVLPENPPTTLEEALEIMTNPKEFLKNINNGWGYPIRYKLVPLTSLTDVLSDKVRATIIFRNLEETFVNNTVRFFDNILQAQQKLNDIHQDVLDLNISGSEDIEEFKNEFAAGVDELRKQLGEVFIKVRSGRSEQKELEQLVEKFKQGKFSPDSIGKKLIKWNLACNKLVNVPQKLELYKHACHPDVEWVLGENVASKRILTFKLHFAAESTSEEFVHIYKFSYWSTIEQETEAVGTCICNAANEFLESKSLRKSLLNLSLRVLNGGKLVFKANTKQPVSSGFFILLECFLEHLVLPVLLQLKKDLMT